MEPGNIYIEPVAIRESVFAVVAEDATVGVEDFALGNEAYVSAVFHNGKVPGACVVEEFHHVFHAVADFNLTWRHRHEFAHVHLAVEVGTEHDVSDPLKSFRGVRDGSRSRLHC